MDWEGGEDLGSDKSADDLWEDYVNKLLIDRAQFGGRLCNRGGP